MWQTCSFFCLMVCIFILWTLSFDEQQRFLILTHLNLSVFSFMVRTFMSLTNSSLPRAIRIVFSLVFKFYTLESTLKLCILWSRNLNFMFFFSRVISYCLGSPFSTDLQQFSFIPVHTHFVLWSGFPGSLHNCYFKDIYFTFIFAFKIFIFNSTRADDK